MKVKKFNKDSIEVIWTGEYPHLCSGEWVIRIAGKTLELPEGIVKQPMYTLGRYQKRVGIYPEEYKYYVDGLNKEHWIDVNRDWIFTALRESKIRINADIMEVLYRKIKAVDWRDNSCGGCL